MGQRVLAENAGVESVGYVLPNKHYIPVDMKYIGVDNTTPYVLFLPWNLGFLGIGFCLIVFGDYSIYGIRHQPRVCGAEDDWGATGHGSFLDRCPLPVIADLLRRET
jgi:hypothetical protein